MQDSVATVSVAVIGVALAVSLVLVFRRSGKVAVVVWTAALFLTPVWLGANVLGVRVSILTGMTLLALLASRRPPDRASVVDLLVGALFVSILVAMGLGAADPAHVQVAVLSWLLPYLWGRFVLTHVSTGWVAGCLVVFAVGASLLAVIEFVSGRNLFLSLPGASSSVWGTQQIRGGILRVEGAFGHSIALGAVLAMVAPFVLTLRWPVWVRSIALATIGIAAAMTLSRLGIVGFALGVVLAIVLLGKWIDRAMRATATVLILAGAVVAVPALLDVFGDAGSEAAGSAEYRGDLLSLVDTMQPLGISPAREIIATGEDYWGGFRSIDSALILLGLQFGLIPVAIALLAVVALLLSILRGGATPASIALAAQIPAFATVALITQYAAFVWFMAGLAVASYTVGRRQETTSEFSDRDESTRRLIGAR